MAQPYQGPYDYNIVTSGRVVPTIAARKRTLEEWLARDPAANDPCTGYDLWISTADLPKVGY